MAQKVNPSLFAVYLPVDWSVVATLALQFILGFGFVSAIWARSDLPKTFNAQQFAGWEGG